MNREFQALWDKATQAGRDAVAACNPTPMVVQQHANMLDDNSPVVKQWIVADGACGFAWVKIRPANSAFAKWAKTQPRTGEYLEPRKDSYEGGLCVWITVGNQSIQKKEAYAHAMAKVLREAGINAYPMSRLD